MHYITHYQGHKIVKWAANHEGREAYYVLKLEGVEQLVKISLRDAVELASPNGCFKEVDRDHALLHSQSNVIEDQEVSDGNDITRLCEQIVELDRAVAQHGGRFENQVKTRVRIEGDTFSKDYLPMKEPDAFVPGEPLIPAGVHVMPGGRFLVMFRPPGEDYSYPFVGFHAGKVDDAFPEVYQTMERSLWPAREGGLSSFLFDMQTKLSGKPRITELVRDHLKQSRLVNVGLSAEQREKDAETYYGSASDFGMF